MNIATPKHACQKEKLRKNSLTPPMKLTHILKRGHLLTRLLTNIFSITKQRHFVPLTKHVAMAQTQAPSSEQSERLLYMSVSEHAAAMLVAATAWIALSCAKKKAIMETLTVCKQLMLPIE